MTNKASVLVTIAVLGIIWVAGLAANEWHITRYTVCIRIIHPDGTESIEGRCTGLPVHYDAVAISDH
jgi:hypothetical protein